MCVCVCVCRLARRASLRLRWNWKYAAVPRFVRGTAASHVATEPPPFLARPCIWVEDNDETWDRGKLNVIPNSKRGGFSGSGNRLCAKNAVGLPGMLLHTAGSIDSSIRCGVQTEQWLKRVPLSYHCKISQRCLVDPETFFVLCGEATPPYQGGGCTISLH